MGNQSSLQWCSLGKYLISAREKLIIIFISWGPLYCHCFKRFVSFNCCDENSDLRSVLACGFDRQPDLTRVMRAA